MSSESRCISCNVAVPSAHIKRSLCQHCRDEIMKAGIYMLLKDIVGKLLEHENYTYEITLYDNNIIEIKYEEGEGE